MFMRVDPGITPRRTSGKGHPTVTLWAEEETALSAPIDQVKAAECPLREDGVGTAIVLDMNMGPTAHTHTASETHLA